MLSLSSHPWPSSQHAQKHRLQQIRPSSLSTPKYFSVTECVTRTRPTSSSSTTDVNLPKHADASLRTSSCLLYSSSGHPQYSIHWYRRRRSSRRAPVKAFTVHKYRSTTQNQRTLQSKHRHLPTTRHIPIQGEPFLLS